jgi:SAM-dependent methyltransferase
MERAAFTLLHESETSWWYRGRAAVVRGILDRRLPRRVLSILDFGAGYGGMAATLRNYGSVSAYEPDSLVRDELGARGYLAVYASPGTALAHLYNLIALFDVLEHIENDAAFLTSARAALATGGELVLTVPAMPFLWSAHDVAHHHYRRYTRRTLRTLLELNGYEIVAISYWNMFLFAPAGIARLLGKSGEGSFHLPRLLDTLFYQLILSESFLMRFFPLPFGVSIVAVACKTKSPGDTEA